MVLAVRPDAIFTIILIPLMFYNSPLSCNALATSRSATSQLLSTPRAASTAPTNNLAPLRSRVSAEESSPEPGSASESSSAWNGHVDSDTEHDVDEFSRAHFTPYYIPTGSESIDDSNPKVQYSPQDAWGETRHPDLVQKTMHTTSRTGAKAELEFRGIGIEWFGSLSSKHGIAEVYINDTLNSKVDAYHSTWLKRQRLFVIDHLPYGTHRFAVVNTGRKRQKSGGTFIDIDAFVINPTMPNTNGNPSNRRSLLGTLFGSSPDTNSKQRPQIAEALPRNAQAQSAPAWSLRQEGETGVHAMQLAVISPTHAIIIDKVEHNPLVINGHPAWGALYDFRTNKARPLNVRSNSFCAGGSFLSNGSFINVGGNPVVVDNTGAADFGDTNGLQAVRLFHPDLCDVDGNGCDIIEAPHKLRLASPRWYNTVLRVDDGSAMVLGGSIRGGWINNVTTNNPTFEFFPPKNINGFNGIPIPSPFLADTLNSNLFPIAFLLGDGTIFVAANSDAMIYDWKSNTERRLPQMPNGVRVTYPMTGTATLLPINSSNNYLPVILICGGSTIDDTRAGYDIDSQEPASNQCVRMELSDAGIRSGWEVEQMPQARIMPDAVLLPTGEVLILNGGATGIAGYGNVKNQVGYSNADNPALTPVLYKPGQPTGSRFSSDGMPSSDIPRLYHSVATLIPDGRIMITGSNPNLDRSTRKYETEYRVEWLSPGWMNDATSRPTINSAVSKVAFDTDFQLDVDLKGAKVEQVKVALMDLGFVTHSLHMNGRLVYLDFTVAPSSSPTRRSTFQSRQSASLMTLYVHSPPRPGVYPPGPGWIYLVVGEKWSEAIPVMIGDGSNPPEDPGALENMLNNSDTSEGGVTKTGNGEGDESL